MSNKRSKLSKESNDFKTLYEKGVNGVIKDGSSS